MQFSQEPAEAVDAVQPLAVLAWTVLNNLVDMAPVKHLTHSSSGRTTGKYTR